jgi:1-acyl-sn-glycerol-3-phosphate acyltransferase
MLKLLVPLKRWRERCTGILNALAENWVGCNVFYQRHLFHITWTVSEAERFEKQKWYLVLANHQSWADIMVLQHLFYRRIPFLKFFLKKELFWIPILGQAWWALDFPFMKRYAPSRFKKKPQHKGKDLEVARKACSKFKHRPVSVMNFVEGTRFSSKKRDTQRSPYTHLLKTRAGGTAFVIAGLRDKLHRILDVTIVYPQGPKNFWAFACGDVREIKVHIDSRRITKDLVGDYAADRHFRMYFHQWLNQLWSEKDRHIATMLA